MKLPKQWNHWCYRLKLTDTMKKKKYRHKYVSLIGHGRHWRVNSLGEFQYSEIFETFDKWSNSLEKTFAIPNTYEQLKSIVLEAKVRGEK